MSEVNAAGGQDTPNIAKRLHIVCSSSDRGEIWRIDEVANDHLRNYGRHVVLTTDFGLPSFYIKPGEKPDLMLFVLTSKTFSIMSEELTKIVASWKYANQLRQYGHIGDIAFMFQNLTLDQKTQNSFFEKKFLEVFNSVNQEYNASIIYDLDSDFRSTFRMIVDAWLSGMIGIHDFNYLPPAESIPSQTSQAFLFGGADNEPLTLIEQANDTLLDTPDQRQGYDDIKERAEELFTACGNSNRLEAIRRRTTKLISTMGNSLKQLQIRAFWTQMNSLRRHAEADERVQQSSNPDDPPLPEGVAALLLDLVENLNVFAAYEPKLVELDEVAQDPASRGVTSETLAAAGQISFAARTNPAVIDRVAAESLQEAAEEAQGAGPSAERANQFSVRSNRNFSLEVLRRVYKALRAEPGFAWKEMRAGVYRVSGPAIVCAMGTFVVKYQHEISILLNSLNSHETLDKILSCVIAAFT